jgi:hypothetical protein
LLVSAAAGCGSEGKIRLLEAPAPDACSSAPVRLSYRTAFGGRVGYRIAAVEVVHAPVCAGRTAQITLRDSAGTVVGDGSAVISPRTTLTVVAIAGRPAAELVVGSTVQMGVPVGPAPSIRPATDAR